MVGEGFRERFGRGGFEGLIWVTFVVHTTIVGSHGMWRSYTSTFQEVSFLVALARPPRLLLILNGSIP